MKFRTLFIIAIIGISLSLSFGVYGQREILRMENDLDGDGVPDSEDLCPSEDASNFDRDGDGCIDDAIGARHIEYWGIEDLPFVYYINENGVAGIEDGSDFSAIHNGIGTWPAIPNTDFQVTYGGSTTQEDAVADDMINLVTFTDDEYNFSSATLAVGISTSFTTDTLIEGTWYRPGQIIDADMIFNPDKNYGTPTAGDGIDLQSVVTHEAAHLFGISHSAIKSSTMFFVLPWGQNAANLELDDQLVFLKAYPTPGILASASRLGGTVIDGETSDPVPGAIIFVMNAANGDTVASDYTLPDGSYMFLGIPDGDYYVSIYPLNGSSAIGYLQPSYVNSLLAETAVTLFVPEYYDAGESAFDDPDAKQSISVIEGTSVMNIDLVTNIDNVPVAVDSVTPGNLADDVPIDAALLIYFSEPIDDATIAGNFVLEETSFGTFISGNAAILNDDSILAFTPQQPLDFETNYTLTLGTGLEDKYGNGLTSEFEINFDTEIEPSLSISSMSPSKGVVGSIIVINGKGFSEVPIENSVTFAGETAVVQVASPRRLIVKVPEEGTSGEVTVQVGLDISNGLTFTMLSESEIARGFEAGITNLESLPRSIAITPDGLYAYIATAAGASAVAVNPGLPDYLNNHIIPITDGLNDIDVTPEGTRAYGISTAGGKLHVIDSDPNDGLLFNSVIDEIDLGCEPLGILIEPNGHRAFISNTDGEIQIWDVKDGSLTRNRQIGVIVPPDPCIRGKMAIDPLRDILFVLSGSGDMLTFDLFDYSLIDAVTVGIDPIDVIVDPASVRAYISDGSGNVAVFSIEGNFKVQDMNTGGSLRGLTIIPAGHYLYAANRELDLLDVIDLEESNTTFRSVVATVPLEGGDPVDTEISPDGFYAFSLLQGSNNLVVTTIGLGPTLKSLSKRGGPIGTQLVLAGTGLMGQEEYVYFEGGVYAEPYWSTGTAFTVIVPPGAKSGPVYVVTNDSLSDGPQFSNELYFEVLEPSDPANEMRVAYTGSIDPDNPESEDYYDLQEVIAVSPIGDQALVGTISGKLIFFDTNPESPGFNQIIGYTNIVSTPAAITNIAITPDGKKAYITTQDSGGDISIVNCNRSSGDYMSIIGTVDQGQEWLLSSPNSLTISPDGETMIALDWEMNNIHFFDLTSDIDVDTAGVGIDRVCEVAFHPGGMYAYFINHGYSGIQVIDMNPLSGNFRTIVQKIAFIETTQWPSSIAFTPDGSKCLILCKFFQYSRPTIRVFNTTDPLNPVETYPFYSFGEQSVATTGERIRITPRGDRAICHMNALGIYYFDISTSPFSEINHLDVRSDTCYDCPDPLPDLCCEISSMDQGFTPDGSRLYSIESFGDSLFIYDFYQAATLMKVSGDLQSGLPNRVLPAPLRVRVYASTSPAAGVPITFTVVDGNGVFENTGTARQVVATDSDGYAEVSWSLGDFLGENQSVIVESMNLTGSGMLFVCEMVEDPAELPLVCSEVLPVASTNDVNVTTAVMATFSRGVDPLSINSSTFYLQGDGVDPVVALAGFADEHRRVSLSPVSALDYTSSYWLNLTNGILDDAGGSLENPFSSLFITQNPPPTELESISPPSATEEITIVLAGAGFDPNPVNNTVFFGTLPAVPEEAAVNYLKVTVPEGAVSSDVKVLGPGGYSNSLPFKVLVPVYSPVDDVIASVATGTSAKSIVVTPDGTIAYSVSPEGNVVIPISITAGNTLESIPVGDDPVAIVMHPEGNYIYIANFGSGSVSVIDIDPLSTRFNDVVATLIVGANPVDLAVNPNGDLVYVANAGSEYLSLIDSNSESETHNQVIASVATGASVKSIVITPDGTRIYLGVDTGFVVLSTVDYGVIASVATGSSAKSIKITPDGALLIILTTEGETLIIDIISGNLTENQVIASVASGSSVKSIQISPDGLLLYLIQEESDLVIVFSLEIIGSTGVLDPDCSIPPNQLVITPVDSFLTGDDPAYIAFDLSGSGLMLITNAGDKSVSFINYSGDYSYEADMIADIHVSPRIRVEDGESHWWHARYVTAWIELPQIVSPGDIDVSSIRMMGLIPAEVDTEIEDSDSNGTNELKVKFDRVQFEQIVLKGISVPVTITGEANGLSFMGEEEITTVRPDITFPSGGILLPGEFYTITWETPQGYGIDSADVHWTDGTKEFENVAALNILNTGSVQWYAPYVNIDSLRVLVTLYAEGVDIGAGMNADEFSLFTTVDVLLSSFKGSVENDRVILRWDTQHEGNLEGFHVLRCEKSADGFYENISANMIVSQGNSGGSSYEFFDSGITMNKTYYYKLEAVSSSGSNKIYGLCRVAYAARFRLEQNVPNPFNPATRIRFTIPQNSNVKLMVYDVAGRKIRTLLDGFYRADNYSIIWNGMNDEGNKTASGVYFYRLKAGKFLETKKMVILR